MPKALNIYRNHELGMVEIPSGVEQHGNNAIYKHVLLSELFIKFSRSYLVVLCSICICYEYTCSLPQ